MAETLPISTIRTEPSGQEHELKDAKARQNLTELSDDIANFDLELEGIKKSVSDGKILLADAITQKGVITEANSSLPYMAENIYKIRSGGGYSGPYYSLYNTSTYNNKKVPVYNGYPYVYVSDSGNLPKDNNIAILADYEWQDSNDWHLVSQYYNSKSGTDWLDSLFIMGLYNIDTQTGLGLTSANPSKFYLRYYTIERPDKYTEFGINADGETLKNLRKVFFDLHYKYDVDKGIGRLALSYADATKQVLKWVTMFDQLITLSPKSYGVPIFLTGPENLARSSRGYTDRYLHIGESALVLDGYIAWGNSTVYPFRDGEIPYGLDGWHSIGGNWYYYEDGQRVLKTGWQDIRGGRYYFDLLGVEQKSTWIDDTYWVGEDGKMATNQWITNEANNNKYYVGADGARVTGLQDIGSDRYFFNDDGVMLTGWQTVDGGRYYFNEAGVMQRNAWVESASGNMYYLDADGLKVVGWFDIGDDRYFFNANGAMQKNRWIEDTYWVGADGKMARDEWVDGGKYYVGPDGKLVKDAVKPTE